MTTEFSYSASYDVNKYIWNRLTTATVLNASDYVLAELGISLVPIIPVQEVAELANHLDNKAYLVYDVMTVPTDVSTPDAWWISKDEITYAVYAPDLAKLNEIVNCIQDAMVKQDESARAIMATTGLSNRFWFHNTDVPWVDISKHADQEDGRYVAEIQVCYNYSNR